MEFKGFKRFLEFMLLEYLAGRKSQNCLIKFFKRPPTGKEQTFTIHDRWYIFNGKNIKGWTLRSPLKVPGSRKVPDLAMCLQPPVEILECWPSAKTDAFRDPTRVQEAVKNRVVLVDMSNDLAESAVAESVPFVTSQRVNFKLTVLHKIGSRSISHLTVATM